MGGRQPVAARLQALISIPPGCFEQPDDGDRHLWEGRDVQVLILPVLPAPPSQMPVLAKNVAVQGGDNLPNQ